jgi:hypothetical protein
VIGHGFLAAGMLLTGPVTAFPLVLLTQVLWALGWACSGGADVAWLTDELGQPDRIARVLTARARWDLIGGMAGMIAFGVLGWAASLTAAIAASGVAMALLGLFVAARFPEDNFRPAAGRRHAGQRRGHDHLAVSPAAGGPGFPGRSGAVVHGARHPGLGGRCRRAAHRGSAYRRVRAARASYALACLFGTLGLLLLAAAPNALIGNSFLSQAETVGEVLGGGPLAARSRARSGMVPRE